MNRWYSLFVAVFFLGSLCALPFMALLTKDALISEFEKRRLATLPELNFNIQSLVKFPHQFDLYWNDHIGVRDQLIGLHNAFNFKVFRKSPITTAMVGEKEWLFFNADGELLDFMGLMKKDFSTLEGYRHVLEDRRDWLRKFGIRYLFLPVPNKMMVYEEYLPWRVRRKKRLTVYDQLMDHMYTYSDFKDFLDLKAILLQAKKERQVYFRTDTHWNLDGALIADQAIIHHLQQWFPQLQGLELSDLQRSDLFYRGDLAILMHLQGDIGEKASTLEVKSSCRNKLDQKLFGFVNSNPKLAGVPQFLPETNGCDSKRYKALVIHDSFGLFLRPYLSEQFGRVIYMNYSNFSGMKAFIEQERPDVVIDQRVARNLPLSLAQDQEIEKELVQDAFVQNTDACLRLEGKELFSEIMTSHELRVKQDRDGALMNAIGTDPYLLYSSEKCEGKGEVLVHISLTSSQETDTHFYYTTQEQSGFSPLFSRTLHIQQGENHLFFRVPSPGIADKIRLDPGKVTGQYVLRALIIKNNSVKTPAH